VNGTTARTVADAPSGILTAHVEPGHPWEAVRALREAIQDLRQAGQSPELAFLYGIAKDGKLSSLGAACLIVLGYAA
jgi:hypothetical protein